MESFLASVVSELPGITGYVYPNEYEHHWGILIVIYPYLTGLVAGAFILASLERVFNVKVIQPVYRLSLLSALAFLFVAPLPLLAHLGHPERSFEMFLTPHSRSAMAMFGFVYAWYLMVVLLLEIWFDYRRDMVVWAKEKKGLSRYVYKLLCLGANDLSPKAIRFDDKVGKIITIIGIPSAFLLHGYVGFIFGSIKANPWWSSVLMPIVFLFSAIVSGIALVLLIYMVTSMFRWRETNMACLNKLAEFLLYAMIVDFSLELLDFIQRLYESEESITILSQMISSRLFISLIVSQVILGSIAPMIAIVMARFGRMPDEMRRMIYFMAAILVQVGIFSTRWNVVVGGQLFSKSLRGLTVYKLDLFGIEGLLMSAIFLILPFIILYVLAKLLPPWPETQAKVPIV
ncbi:MAG TPA: NrfD/PsrC family molybdoenzyme membrane anchor subunit [Candidatus Deferrimicrobium sp.]|nr:NrfD/PsrC family molybdoenzyme membrane anchor subunit [Candidatus Deferrimicrobium sp.]